MHIDCHLDEKTFTMAMKIVYLEHCVPTPVRLNCNRCRL